MSERLSGRLPGRALLAAGLAGALALAMVGTGDTSSHREAPLIMEDPVADNTDMYAFVAPDAPNRVTLISNFVPFQEAGGGPNYHRFGEDVRYNIHVDNNGDAQPDITYEFRFKNDIQNPDDYLYADSLAVLNQGGGIDSLDDPAYNFRQTMSVWKVTDGEREQVLSDAIVPPENVGPRTIATDYESLAQEAIYTLDSGGKVFAGQRDDGFYVDIASIFDLGGLRPFNDAHAVPLDAEAGKDTFAGYNVHSIALQIPTNQLTSGDDPVIGTWSTADRRRVRAFAGSSSANPISRGRWTQVSRLGNPLVNEVVVPLGTKDAYNSIPPAADADVFPGLDAPPLSTEGDIPLVTDPMLGNQIEAVYDIDVPDPPRNDLVSVYLTGIDGVNQPSGDVRPAEMLRLNTDVEPTPFDQQDRLGFLAGQNDGFPNGRRVGDDVVDISLRAVAGGTPLTPDFNSSPNNELSDGVDSNDRPYLEQFPYLGTPHQGYELDNEQRVPGGS